MVDAAGGPYAGCLLGDFMVGVCWGILWWVSAGRFYGGCLLGDLMVSVCWGILWWVSAGGSYGGCLLRICWKCYVQYIVRTHNYRILFS